ncbi:polysaccharide pyruvyl transferase family protein [Rathayibacter sp. PhB152]|uniref:polysaccharide pyruvyl transferase family protein n=1 Tax=Rathayibacter sp. PhB152 TaxID=2485190 RepID=UPI0011CDA0D0|nr:polysaccharide pyruvyl transferase family protein [Rathayibacter sp. PhB152]
MTRSVFVRGTGQEDNIGDVVLRRELFDRLRAVGALHLFLGDASKNFIEALALESGDVVYSDMKTWKRAAIASAVRGSTWFVDKPGEVLVTRDIYLGQRSLLPLIAAVRVTGGRVLRLGIGQRVANPAVVPMFRRLYRLSNLVAWRDPESAAAFGIGEVMPDWGFAAVGSDRSQADRGSIVLSYRSDRTILAAPTLEGIRRFAERAQLSVIVCTQVGRDNERTRELAKTLGSAALLWDDGVPHAEQEERLREVYRSAALVVSDRLHVLIVGATEGAVPVNLVDEKDPKVARHFDAIEYRGVTVLSEDLSADAVADALARQLLRRAELDRALEVADEAIERITRRALHVGVGL